MRSVQVTGPGAADWVEVPKPQAGRNDVLLRMRACGICGSDAMYTDLGGLPPREGATPLGHEGAAEVVHVGSDVVGFSVGDRVVVDGMALTDGLLGSGGAQGGLSEFVLVSNAVVDRQLKIIPPHIPWEVAALNEPMAVALHAVNRTNPQPDAKVVVFGAGPIGLGAVLGYRRRGASHIVVVDIVPERLKTAMEVGADSVINSAQEDVGARLVELHGVDENPFIPGARAGTDIYLDAAGASSVPSTVALLSKHGATLGIVAVHKAPVTLDFNAILTTELTVVWSMGYPSEIFDVTDDIIEHWERYARIVSHTVPYEHALDALELARTPGAADKVVVTFG